MNKTLNTVSVFVILLSASTTSFAAKNTAADSKNAVGIPKCSPSLPIAINAASIHSEQFRNQPYARDEKDNSQKITY